MPAFADYTPPAGTLVPAGQFIWQAYLVRAAPIPVLGLSRRFLTPCPPPLSLQLDMTGRDGPSTCLSSAHPRRTHLHGEMAEMCREAVVHAPSSRCLDPPALRCAVGEWPRGERMWEVERAAPFPFTI